MHDPSLRQQAPVTSGQRSPRAAVNAGCVMRVAVFGHGQCVAMPMI
jgi:hypothetical protein